MAVSGAAYKTVAYLKIETHPFKSSNVVIRVTTGTWFAHEFVSIIQFIIFRTFERLGPGARNPKYTGVHHGGRGKSSPEFGLGTPNPMQIVPWDVVMFQNFKHQCEARAKAKDTADNSQKHAISREKFILFL